MRQHYATLAVATLCALLAGATSGFAQQPASDATSCHAAPKGAAPQGKHWYYHLDRKTKAKCWYLGEAGLKTYKPAAKAAAASEPASDSKPTPDPKPEAAQAAPLQRNIADARNESPSEADAEPAMTPSIPEPSTSADNNAPPAEQPSLMLAQPDNLTSTPAPLSSRFSAAETPSDQTTGLAPRVTPQAAAPAAQAPVPPSADDDNNSALNLAPWRIALGVLFVGLGILAILGAVAFRYLKRAPRITSVPARERRNIWAKGDETDAEPAYAEMIMPSRRAPAAKTPRDLDEIEQLLRQAARREPGKAESSAIPTRG